MQKLVLSALAVSASSMIYRAFVALLDKKLDWVFAVLVLATLGVGSWYVVLLVEDRDSTITALKEQIGTSVDVPSAVTPGRPQPSRPGTSPALPSTTPAESALPDFDQSGAGTYSTGTVKLTIDKDGLDIHQSSWTVYNYDSEDRDISFRGTGVSGQNGTQFVPLSAGSDKSFATCQGQTSWVPILSWNQIERGSFACVKASSGRRGILRIDQMPNLDSREPTVQVTGVLWAPVVDR